MSTGPFTAVGGIIIVDPSYARVPLFWIITLRMIIGVVGSLLVFMLFPNRISLIYAKEL